MAIPGSWGWSGAAAALDWDYGPSAAAREAKNYSLSYAKLRQLGLPHEAAVQGAQRAVYGRVRSQYPRAESAYNRNWAVTPLSSPLPAAAAGTATQAQALADQLQQAPIPVAQVPAPPAAVAGERRRMAMRYGPGLLAAALLGYIAGDAISDGQQRAALEQRSA